MYGDQSGEFVCGYWDLKHMCSWMLIKFTRPFAQLVEKPKSFECMCILS